MLAPAPLSRRPPSDPHAAWRKRVQRPAANSVLGEQFSFSPGPGALPLTPIAAWRQRLQRPTACWVWAFSWRKDVATHAGQSLELRGRADKHGRNHNSVGRARRGNASVREPGQSSNDAGATLGEQQGGTVQGTRWLGRWRDYEATATPRAVPASRLLPARQTEERIPVCRSGSRGSPPRPPLGSADEVPTGRYLSGIFGFF